MITFTHSSVLNMLYSIYFHLYACINIIMGNSDCKRTNFKSVRLQCCIFVHFGCIICWIFIICHLKFLNVVFHWNFSHKCCGLHATQMLFSLLRHKSCCRLLKIWQIKLDFCASNVRLSHFLDITVFDIRLQNFSHSCTL